MKKTISFICAIFIALALLMPCFCCAKTTSDNEIAFAGIEDDFYTAESIDLISKNPSGSITNGIIEDVAPFDTSTNKKMEGMSITPTSDDYGQIKSKSFKINQYNPSEDDVVYLWIYLIDTVSFHLNITLTDNMTKSLMWHFDSLELYEIGTGWKLLGLKLSDFNSDEFVSNTYEYIMFNYEMEDTGDGNNEDVAIKASEKLSFFHIFVSNVSNPKIPSGKVAELSNSFYKLTEDLPFGETVFVGDKIKIQKPEEMFEYLYIGKYDLSNYTTSGKYYWTLIIESPSRTRTNIDFGDTILFTEQGFYQLTIQLIEVGTFSNQIRLNKDISIFCDEAHLGYFSMGTTYKIKDTESILIAFKLAQNFVQDEELKVSLNNKNAEIETYYEEDGFLYIFVSGKSGGNTTLEIFAKGSTLYNSEKLDLVSSAIIEIESTEKKMDVFLVILWITFACFCVVIIIYLIISLVKARKNDVK